MSNDTMHSLILLADIFYSNERFIPIVLCKSKGESKTSMLFLIYSKSHIVLQNIVQTSNVPS